MGRAARLRALCGAVVAAVCVALPATAAASAPAKRTSCATKATKSVERDGKIKGTKRGEIFNGAAGNERIFAGGGRDIVCARRGKDKVKGGSGRDRILGSLGIDRLIGNGQRDFIHAGRGDDKVNVADGAPDKVLASRGDDVVMSRDGLGDSISCGPGDDTVKTEGDDTLSSCETVKLGRPEFALPAWSDNDWSLPQNYATIQTADVDGDGDDELLGRTDARLQVHDFDTSVGQWVPLPAIENFTGGDGIGGGWDQPQYYSTIQAADLDGDGAEEVFGRFDGGIAAFKYDKTAQQWNQLPSLTGPNAPSDPTWAEPQYYSTIQAADLDGDGTEEIFARAADGLRAWSFDTGTSSWTNLGDATGPGAWSDSGGWNQPQYYSTIQAADLDPSRPGEEIFARNDDGLVTWGFGGGTWTANPVPALTDVNLSAPRDDQGWNQEIYYATIHSGDFNGDGADEAFGRASYGVVTWSYDHASGTWRNLPVNGLPDNPSWNDPQYYETIQAGDITGDGADELLMRASWGLNAQSLSGGEWVALPTQGDFANSYGWSFPAYYDTIQTARVGVAPKALQVIGRAGPGIVSYGFDTTLNSWVGLSAEFPEFTGGQAAAYAYVNKVLGTSGGVTNPTFDIRNKIQNLDTGADLNNLQSYENIMQAMKRPKNASFSSADFDHVIAELAGTPGTSNVGEVGNAMNVYSHFVEDLPAYLGSIYSGMYNADTADKLIQQLKENQEYREKATESIESAFEFADVLAVIPEVGEAIEVVDALVSASFTLGVALSSPGKAALEASYTYQELKSEINDLYNEMQAQLVEAHTEIVNDYGLMTAVGEISQVGLLPTTTGEAGIRTKARMIQGSVVQLWQTVTPETWVIYRTDGSSNAMRDICGDIYNSEGNCWDSGDGYFWSLSWNRAASPRICPVLEVNAPCKSIEASDELHKTLFDEPSGSLQDGTGCYAVFTQSCDLGVPFADVFHGKNGWDLPVRKCTDTNISYRCPLP